MQRVYKLPLCPFSLAFNDKNLNCSYLVSSKTGFKRITVLDVKSKTLFAKLN